MALGSVALACESQSSAADDEGGNDGGKADCIDGGDSCSTAGQPLPMCEDGEELGCLRHGISEAEWNTTAPEFVNPGWDRATRQQWHHQDQGTKILPLSWLLALDSASPKSPGPLLSDANLAVYGMMPDHDPMANPYQLPVGFSIIGDFDLEGGVEDTLYGYTCSACHTQLIDIETAEGPKRQQVAGGAGLHDFDGWNGGMGIALITTQADPARRAAFVERVQALQEQLYGEALDTAHIETALAGYAMAFKESGAITQQVQPTTLGPGRLDALNRGFTTLHYDYLKPFVGQDGFSQSDLDSNLAPIDGMVSLPPVYDGPKWDWAEYGHSIRQPFARNTSEAVAVNSRTNLATLEGEVNAEGLFWIEQQLRRLQGPAYPGKIDETKRLHGQALFWGQNENGAEDAASVHCARCHAPRETYDGIEWKLNTVALGTVGTDPNTLTRFAQREVTLPTLVWKSFFTPRVTEALNRLLGLDLDPNTPTRVPAGLALFGLVDGLCSKLFTQEGWDWAKGTTNSCSDPSTWHDGSTCEATHGRSALYRIDIPRTPARADTNRDPLDPMLFLPSEGFDGADPRCDEVPASDRTACLENLNWLAYRARPLHGMWLAAPYLHNNSVPNLCDLLGPAEARPTSFYVGNIEYDDTCLGYVSEEDADRGVPTMPDGVTPATKFEVGKSGNGNRGHEFASSYDPAVGPRGGVIGRALSPDEILAIAEYIKSLPALPPGPDGKSHVGDYVDERFDALR